MGDDENGDGEEFGPYRLESLLGRGGMGEVWRAYDTRREREVALKRLSGGWAHDDQFRERFRLEARTTARLGSPNVVPIHDFGEIDGRLFIDMRLIRGGDLADLLVRHPRGLPATRAVDVVEQVAGALETAHGDGLVHRDVKPSNVLIESDGVREIAYLVDFGIAKLALEVTGANLTMTGATLGTPAYMAPELFDGASGATVASDVYALGCVLHETLTGRRPFSGAHAMVLMNQHLHQAPSPPSSVDPELARFDALLARALSKDPAARPASAGELRAELLDAGAARPIAPRPTTGPSPAVGPGQHPGAARPVTPRPATGPGPAVAPRPGTGPNPGTGPSPTAGPGPRVGPGLGPGSGFGPWRPASGPGDDGVTTIDFGTGRSRRRRRGIVITAIAAAAVVVAAVVTTVALTGGGTEPAAAPPAALPPPALTAPERVLVALSSPSSLVFSPDGRRAYVLNSDSATVIVVDAATRATVATVPIGQSGLDEIAVSSDGRRVYVPRSGDDASPGSSLAVIDTASNTVVANVPVPLRPFGVGVSPDGQRVYVSSVGTTATPGTTVSVVDTASNTVVATVPAGNVPLRLAVSPDGRQVYVATYGLSTEQGGITAIDTATNTPTGLPSGDTGPKDVAVSPDGQRVYLAALGTTTTHGSVQLLDPVARTVTAVPIPGPQDPLDVAVSPDGRTLLVSYYGTDAAPGHTLAVVDTTTLAVRRLVPFPGRPWSAAVTPDGREAWVTTNKPDELWRIPLP